jgi:sugar phosphate isomerase/epimerase
MHPRLSVDQISFGNASLAEFIDHARALGAAQMVLTSPQLLAAGGLNEARQALSGGGPLVEAISHPFAIYPSLDCDCAKASDTLLRLIDIGAALQTKSIYLLTGGRGSMDWQQAADRFAQVVAPCQAAARARGIALLIENASALYADIHIAHSLADTIALAEHADVGICMELFFCWAEADLKRLFQRALPRCGLVQLSDYVLGDRSLPGRAVPGDGVIPLGNILRILLELGYAGTFDIELVGPRIVAEGHWAATERAAAYLSTLLTTIKPEY